MDDFKPTSFKGCFIMAMPALQDPNFRQSVTCISEHTDEGAVGIVINQLHDGLNGKMIFDELGMVSVDGAASIPVHVGGPVHSNELFVLHGPPLDWGTSLKINESLALSNSIAILEAIAKGVGPGDFLVCLGCAGWAPGQLEWELSQNAWLVSECDDEIIFKCPEEEKWERAIRRLGIDPQLLSDSGGHA
jgi:putative transcriptional regulator